MIHPRTKVLQRRREVVSYLVRGIPPSEIAEMLHVPRHTIYNDIRVIRSGRYETLNAHSRREMVAQLYLNLQARMRYLWDLADKAESEYVCLWTMRELRLNDEHILNKLPPILSGAELKEKEAMRAHVKGIIHSLLHKKPRPVPPPPPVELPKKPGMTKEEIEERDRREAEIAERERRREEIEAKRLLEEQDRAKMELEVKQLFEKFGMTEEEIIESKRRLEEDAMTEEEIAEEHRKIEEEAMEIARRRAEEDRRQMEAEGGSRDI